MRIGYPAADAFDDADHVRGLAAERHEVDEPDGSLIGVEFGFQHHGVAAVPAARRADWAGRGDQPAAVFFGPEQSSEDRAGVEPGHAEPVDRPVAADQRRGLGVADDRVILNGQRQGDLLGSEPSHRFARWRHVFDPRRTSNAGCTGQCTHRRLLISLYRLPTDCVVAHSCRNRTSSAVAVGGAHGRKPASRFPGTPGGGGLGRAGMLSCHQPKGSS